MSLKTDFVKVAQSGKTIDGREIKPEWLLDAAATYSRETYTASVFPDHNEMAQSYGTVEELRAEKKGDVVSLYARISPNAFWQSDMRYGQNLFTSIAIMPNFAGTGKFYLYSLAATNNPASLGVEKLEFSKKEPTALFSIAFDTKQADSNLEFTEHEKGLFSRFIQFFKQENNEMASEEFKKLSAEIETLKKENADLKEFAKKTNGDSPDDDLAVKFSALQKDNADLKAKLDAAEKFNSELSAKLDAQDKKLTEYAAKLDSALEEDPAKSTQPQQQFSVDAGKVVNGIHTDDV